MDASATAEIAAVQALVERPLGPAVAQWLRTGVPAHAFGLPLLALPIGAALDNIWGATTLLQTMRPDLARAFLVIRLLDGRALCIQPMGAGRGDTPLVEIDLHTGDPPSDLRLDFEAYLARARADVERSERAIARIERILAREGYSYDHARGGKLPRAHQTRIVRSCVHDSVVGLAALRQDDRRNDTVIDLFECTDHPLYEPGHGVRSLVSLILADAYKASVSMALRFEPVEGLRGKPVPDSLVELARALEIPLGNPASGVVSSDEGLALFVALSGLSPEAVARVEEAAGAELISLAAVSYLIVSRCWTAQEVEWILAAAPRPAAILFGDDGVEDWLGWSEAAAYGQAAILGTMFRSSLNGGGEEGVEASACRVQGGLLDLELRRDAVLAWDSGRPMSRGHRLAVLPLPRAPLGFETALVRADAERVHNAAPPGSEPILLYGAEAAGVDLEPIEAELRDLGVTVIVSPYRIADLAEIYNVRLARARRVRR